jgi:hypothetical protein
MEPSSLKEFTAPYEASAAAQFYAVRWTSARSHCRSRLDDMDTTLRLQPVWTYASILVIFFTLFWSGLLQPAIGTFRHERVGVSIFVFAEPSNPRALLLLVLLVCNFAVARKCFSAITSIQNVHQTPLARVRRACTILASTLLTVYILYLSGILDAEVETYDFKRVGISIFVFAAPSHPIFLPAIVIQVYMFAKVGASCCYSLRHVRQRLMTPTTGKVLFAFLCGLCGFGEVLMATWRKQFHIKAHDARNARVFEAIISRNFSHPILPPGPALEMAQSCSLNPLSYLHSVIPQRQARSKFSCIITAFDHSHEEEGLMMVFQMLRACHSTRFILYNMGISQQALQVLMLGNISNIIEIYEPPPQVPNFSLRFERGSTAFKPVVLLSCSQLNFIMPLKE